MKRKMVRKRSSNDIHWQEAGEAVFGSWMPKCISCYSKHIGSRRARCRQLMSPVLQASSPVSKGVGARISPSVMLKQVLHQTHCLRHHCHRQQEWTCIASSRARSGIGRSWKPLVSMSTSYHEDVVLATKAVRLASRLCQSVQRGLLAKETQTKSDKSPVTVADYGSQALVSWSLAREYPPGSFSMVAEEDSEELRTEEGAPMLERITQLVNETIAADASLDVAPLSKEDVLEAIERGSSEGGSNGRHWVLDPIDGTRGFVRGDQYAIALGLLDNGKVVAGVLGCPNLPMESIANGVPASSSEPVGCLFSASLGAGSTVESLDGSVEPKPVHVSNVEDTALATFCESYESAHSMQDLTANIAGVLGVKAPPVRIDSQAKYGAMARGDAVIYLRFPHAGYREKIWDHAAGAIVITEAGGEVFDAAGQPLDFSRGRWLDLETGIIATNKKLKPVVLSAVQKCLKEMKLSAKH